MTPDVVWLLHAWYGPGGRTDLVGVFGSLTDAVLRGWRGRKPWDGFVIDKICVGGVGQDGHSQLMVKKTDAPLVKADQWEAEARTRPDHALGVASTFTCWQSKEVIYLLRFAVPADWTAGTAAPGVVDLDMAEYHQALLKADKEWQKRNTYADN